MSDTIQVSMVNVDRIYSLVDELKGVDRNRAIRYGLLQGAKAIDRIGRVNLKSRNNEHTGNLMMSARAKLVRGKVRAYAGFERSYSFVLDRGSGNHAHLVDRGTKERYTKDGRYRGIMPASYFWSDAKSQSTMEVSRHIVNGVERMIQRLNEKYAV